MIKPEVSQCQWEARVGSFMPGTPDHWWSVNVSDDPYSVIFDIKEAIQRIIVPELNKRLSDEGLINNWMNEEFAGTTNIGRFKYLTILLKAKGDFNTNVV